MIDSVNSINSVMKVGKNGRYKATIEFEPDIWQGLQEVAALRNTNVTRLLNDYGRCLIEEKLPSDYESRIEAKIFEVLDRKTESELIEYISLRVLNKIENLKLLIQLILLVLLILLAVLIQLILLVLLKKKL